MPTLPAWDGALRISAVVQKTGLSRTHIYRLCKDGCFPNPRKLSPGVSAWSEADVKAWLATKFADNQAQRRGA